MPSEHECSSSSTRLVGAGRDDRQAANEPGDMTDSAEPLTAEEADDAVAVSLRQRLD